MNTTPSTTPTITVVKEAAKKWNVVNDGEVTATFRTKGQAEAEAEQQLADAAEHQPEPEQVDFAALDKATRRQLMTTERAALKVWQQAGSEGDAPATPLLDWMSSTTPAAIAQADSAKPKAKGTSTPRATDPRVLDAITTGRAAGLSFAAIGRQLDEAGVPTARGGKWDFAVVAAIANRHGIAAKGQAA